MGKMKAYYEDLLSQKEDTSKYNWQYQVFEMLDRMPIETLKVVSKTEELGTFAKIILKEKGIQV